MKKSLIVVLLFLFVPVIKAQEWTSVLPESENIKLLESEVRYRWYKNIKVNERYELLNNVEHNCEYFDEEDYQYTKEEKTYEYPLVINNRIIETHKESINYNDKKFGQILIKNIATYLLKVKDIYIRNKVTDEYYSYKITSYEYIEGNVENINDKNPNSYVTVNTNTKILLDLDQIIPYENIGVKICYEIGGEIKWFDTVFLMDYKYPVRTIRANTEFITRVRQPYQWYYETPTNYNPIDVNEFEREYYMYKDKMIKCFDYKKDFIDGYYSELDGYIKDENKYMIFYKYELIAEVNEIPLEDQIVINENKQTESNIEIQNVKDEEIEEVIQEKKKENVEINYKEIKDNEMEDIQIENKEIIGVINDEDHLAVNYDKKEIKNNQKPIFVYFCLLCLILIFLVLICQKLGKNLKNK